MTSSTAESWVPDWAVTPGEVLQEILDEQGMSQAELARRMSRPTKTINEITRGKAAITPDTAIQLELALDIDSRIFTNLELRYREHLASIRSLELMGESVGWATRFPIRDLKKNGLIEDAKGPDLVASLLRFLGVSSPEGWDRQWASVAASFRASPSFASAPESVAAWLRWGERLAIQSEQGPYDELSFRYALREIRSLTRSEPFQLVIEEAQELCAEAGVAFFVCPEFDATRLSGAAHWTSDGTPIIQVSLRHKTEGSFWFSLFHEAGHVLGKHRGVFVDLDDETDDEESEAEREADQFAQDFLIPPDGFATFVDVADFSAEAVRQYSKEIGIATGILVGRLQHEQLVLFSQLAHLRRTLTWA